MKSAASNVGSPFASAKSPAETKKIVLKEIGAKWGKFSEQDLSSLASKDDLVAQLVAKYGLEIIEAQNEVDAILRGRRL
jgi:hypothetical protein